MGFFTKIFGKKDIVYNEPKETTISTPKVQQFKTYNFSVVGSEHYIDNIKLVTDKNILYQSTKDELDEGEMVFEYDLEDRNDVQLIPEPDNEYDKNAIRVDISGKTVGYIKKGACTRIKNLLKSSDFVKYEVDYIRYGRYKKLKYSYDKDNYTADKGMYDTPQIGITIIMRVNE